MPLRASINPKFLGSGTANMATESIFQAKEPEAIRELPEDPKEDVLFDTLFGLRTIELNRPEKLHALSGSMIRKILPRLQEWAKSDMANVVVIKGSGEKAFCAGGDVVTLAKDNKEGPEGQQKSIDYFAQEYKLDHLIATYSKPYVAFMDGITMGGGVGLSIHAPFRIATERTQFAMPETTIGFFPDVGASFFLPRMPGGVGTYLALTSDKLKGANVYYAGVATHYIHSTSLPALERRLAELRFKDYLSLDERIQLIDSTIEEYSTGLPHDEPILLGGRLRNLIDDVFGKSKSVTEIVSKLKVLAKSTINTVDRNWGQKTLTTLSKRSPTAVHVAFRQMQLGRRWSIAETFQREHQIAAKFMKYGDFTKGVYALLIDKTQKPEWDFETLEGYQIAQAKSSTDLTDSFFRIEGEGAQRLQLLTDGDYHRYPHWGFGIPQEAEVERFVKLGGKTVKQTIDHFVEQKRGKQGVREVMMDIMSRKTYSKNGKAYWGRQPLDQPKARSPKVAE